jgi:hypothetical protein
MEESGKKEKKTDLKNNSGCTIHMRDSLLLFKKQIKRIYIELEIGIN